MRSFKTSLALVLALVLFSGSSVLFAQTETQDSEVSEVEVPTQSDAASLAVDQADAKPVGSDADVEYLKDDVLEDDSVDDRKFVQSKASALDEASEKTDKPEADPVQATTPPVAANAKGGRFALTFDDLKFDMEKTETFDREMLTSKINGYHGGKVKIRGYIRPNFKQSGITKFIFVRDNKECCFGPQAAIFDNVLVRLEKGTSANYTVRPVTIEGDFVLKEYRGDDGNVWSLYRMYNAKMK